MEKRSTLILIFAKDSANLKFILGAMEYVCSVNLRYIAVCSPMIDSALFTDSCLFLVPKSHAIPRDDEQRKNSSTMEPPKNTMDMPGAIRLTLERE